MRRAIRWARRQNDPETSSPLKSNGRRERTMIRPEIPGSTRLAVDVLNASIAATAPAGKSCNATEQVSAVNSLAAVIGGRVEGVVETATGTRPASPCSRSTWIPGIRAALSETVMSGSLPMSSATIASTIWSLLRLMFLADCSARLRPVTTIAFSLVPAPASGLCGASAFAPAARGFAARSRPGWAARAGPAPRPEMKSHMLPQVQSSTKANGSRVA